MTRRTHAFIDGDLVAYRISAGNTKKLADGAVQITPERAKQDVEAYFQRLVDALMPDEITIVYSGANNFRKQLNRRYKSARGAKPDIYTDVQLAVNTHGKVLVIERLEADDVLGMECTKSVDEERILVSYDKDMHSLPGVCIYDTLRGERTVTTEESAERAFWTQCLTGDATDGYYGLPGIGPKSVVPLVDAILALPKAQRLEHVVALYESYYLDRAYALRQCQMAYILRDGDYCEGRIRLFGTDQWL